MTATQFAKEYEKGFNITTRFFKARPCLEYSAEEISQMAWARAWEYRRQYRGESKFCSWVMSIGVNLLRSCWRKEKQSRQEPDDCLQHIPQVSVDLDKKILADEILSQLPIIARRQLMAYYSGELENSSINRIRAYRAVLSARKLIAA